MRESLNKENAVLLCAQTIQAHAGKEKETRRVEALHRVLYAANSRGNNEIE